jgi:hypothetical protein
MIKDWSTIMHRAITLADIGAYKKMKEKPLCSLGYHKLDLMSNAETKLKTTSICCHEFCAAHEPNDST